MKYLLMFLILIAAGPATAQCVGSGVGGSVPFPTQLSFTPAQPRVGQPVSAIIGPEIQEDLFAQVARVGNVINVSGGLSLFGGVPPPPSPKFVALGVFAPGTYTVNLQFTNDDFGTTCTPLGGTFTVTGALPTDAPALSPLAMGLMLCLLLLVAARRLRRSGTKIKV